MNINMIINETKYDINSNVSTEIQALLSYKHIFASKTNMLNDSILKSENFDKCPWTGKQR